MFTGIIEEIGEIRTITPKGDGTRISISCGVVLEGLKPGASVCVNGACLTVARIHADAFEADVSPETRNRSTLGTTTRGTPVNLERALPLGGRLDGHLVTGHVDAMGRVAAVQTRGDFFEISWTVPKTALGLLVEKGSVAVDGISLTVADLDEDGFRAACIPETMTRTNLGRKKAGDPVNIETDLIGKYVARILSSWNTGPKGVTMDKLREEGFLL